MKNRIKDILSQLSIWNLFTSIWKIWLIIFNKTFSEKYYDDLDEFNKASHYIIKYLGLPFLILFITFLFSFTDLWPFTHHSSDILNNIKEIQHKK